MAAYAGLMLLGCPSDDPPDSGDAGADMGADATSDVAADAASDVVADAPSDVVADAPSDVAADAASDVAADTPIDVTADAPDAVADTPADATTAETPTKLFDRRCRRIATYDSYVYCTSENEIIRFPDGGGDIEVLFTSTRATHSLAVDEGGVFWTERGAPTATTEGAVRTCPLTGCAGDAVTIAGGQQHPGAIALSETEVIWVNAGTNDIRRAPRDQVAGSGQVVQSIPHNGSMEFAADVVVVDGTLYYSNPGIVGPTGLVASCDPADCQPQNLITDLAVRSIDHANGRLFVTSETETLQVALDGSDRQALGGGGFDIVATDTDVYWTSQGGVRRCEIGGCASAPAALTSPSMWLRPIGLSETSLYWGIETPPEVWTLPL